MAGRTFSISVLTVLCSYTLNAQDATKQDLDKLRGEWRLVSRSSKVTSKVKQTFKDSECEYETTDQNGKVKTGKVTIKIDATKEPKIFDRTASSGDVRLGIYKLEEDTLTICSALASNKVRPKDFKELKDIEDGGGVSLTVWKRADK